MKKIVLFALPVLMFACGDSSDNSDNGIENKVEDSSDVVLDTETEDLKKYPNILSYTGALGEYEVFFEVFTDGSDGYTTGSYFYTENGVSFDLFGERNGSELELKREEDGEIKETFNLQFDEDFLVGSWTKAEEMLDVELELEPSKGIPSSLPYTAAEIGSQGDDIETSLNYEELEKISIENDQLIAKEGFEGGWFSNDKIYLFGFYDSEFGGHNSSVLFVALDDAMDGMVKIAKVMCVVSDVYEGEIETTTYKCVVQVFYSAAAETWAHQSIIMEGEGEASFYFGNDMLVVNREGERYILKVVNGEFVEE
ncbi:MAG: hypothetical protein MK078_08155 [Crocinitomicaceae bacterium]|nr:hypothetical protein [Crocinitomicaceae bacterium]